MTEEGMEFSYNSPFGPIRIVARESGLTRLAYDTTAQESPKLQSLNPVVTPEAEYIGEAIRWLDLYFSGEVPDFTPRLSFEGEKRDYGYVWEALAEVPYGSTRSYGALSKRIEERHDSHIIPRHIGRILSQNRFHLLIPCHRIINANGTLGGYAPGPSLKHLLLRHEGATLL